jgi:hypothetical protein
VEHRRGIGNTTSHHKIWGIEGPVHGLFHVTFADVVTFVLENPQLTSMSLNDCYIKDIHPADYNVEYAEDEMKPPVKFEVYAPQDKLDSAM